MILKLDSSMRGDLNFSRSKGQSQVPRSRDYTLVCDKFQLKIQQIDTKPKRTTKERNVSLSNARLLEFSCQSMNPGILQANKLLKLSHFFL